MLGIGAVMTSSPSRPSTGSPRSSNASTRAPRQRQEISPSYTGSSGDPPTKPVHTSVPPDSEASSTCPPTASYTQRKPSAGSGAPVEPTPRNADRSASSRGTMPALRQAIRNGAEVPKYVMPASAASRHNPAGSGAPSYSTTAAPTAGPDIRKFHIIQPVVVYQKNRSPGPRSWCSASIFRCSSRIPPWPCTIGLGNPVVPEEYSTYSGWSNGTGANSSGSSVS